MVSRVKDPIIITYRLFLIKQNIQKEEEKKQRKKKVRKGEKKGGTNFNRHIKLAGLEVPGERI